MFMYFQAEEIENLEVSCSVLEVFELGEFLGALFRVIGLC